MAELLTSKDRPTAIIAANDLTAIGALRALHRADCPHRRITRSSASTISSCATFLILRSRPFGCPGTNWLRNLRPRLSRPRKSHTLRGKFTTSKRPW